jgi:hypothetical protein
MSRHLSLNITDELDSRIVAKTKGAETFNDTIRRLLEQATERPVEVPAVVNVTELEKPSKKDLRKHLRKIHKKHKKAEKAGK